MQAVLIRHGRTPGNDERRYIGRTDESLSARGKAEAEKAVRDFEQKKVYVSPLKRARETAAILFPNAEQIILPGLRETDFGSFEGKTADEMADDADYRAWVDGMCLGTCPGGESRADVTRRAVEAFECAVREEATCEKAAIEEAAREEAALEGAAREEAVRESTVREEAAREETAREEAVCAGADCAENSRASLGNAAEEVSVVFVTHGGVIMSILEALAVPHRDYYDYYTPNLGGWMVTCTEKDGRIILHEPKKILLQ